MENGKVGQEILTGKIIKKYDDISRSWQSLKLVIRNFTKPCVKRRIIMYIVLEPRPVKENIVLFPSIRYHNIVRKAMMRTSLSLCLLIFSFKTFKNVRRKFSPNIVSPVSFVLWCSRRWFSSKPGYVNNACCGKICFPNQRLHIHGRTCLYNHCTLKHDRKYR